MVPRGKLGFDATRKKKSREWQAVQTDLSFNELGAEWEGATSQGWHSSGTAPTSSAWAVNQFREGKREAGGYTDKVLRWWATPGGGHDSWDGSRELRRKKQKGRWRPGIAWRKLVTLWKNGREWVAITRQGGCSVFEFVEGATSPTQLGFDCYLTFAIVSIQCS